MISLLISYGKEVITYLIYLSRKNICVIKEAVGNKKKIDIDLTLFLGKSTIKYVVWCPD